MPDSSAPSWPSFFHSLGVRLFLWLCTLVIVAFAAYAWLSFQSTSREWRKTVESGALAWSDLIQQATHYGMLLNRKEDVHQIIRTVAATPGVVGVRVYDKQGVIIYSADDGEIGRRVDVNAEACVVCHRGNPPLSFVPSGERVRVFRAADGSRVLGLINPIENSPGCSNGPCHAHRPSQAVLGVLDVKMSLAEADRRLAEARRLHITAAVAMALLVGASSALFIHFFVRRPVRTLIAGTERIAQGDLATTLDAGSYSEIGQLSQAFNRMTHELALSHQENEEWASSLERKVIEETEKLSRTQRQVVHMEKMASLGTLAATVAHEINNPLAGILNYAKLVERSLPEGISGEMTDEEREEIRRFLHIIQQESTRCGKIVRNFLLFARHSGGEMALHPLHPIVERSLEILRHHLEMNRIELLWTHLEEDDQIVCDAGQIQQALLDLFVNAVEAMPEGGTLTVRLRALGGPEGSVEITVADTGVGIPDDLLTHIFEPFFTTKDKAGSGLGLSVVYGIVERHGGRIDVESKVGQGTTFRLVLPRHPPVTGSEEKQ